SVNVELASRAKRDLRRLDKQTRDRVLDPLRSLAKDAPNLDTRTLKGTQSALRPRAGEHRVLYRHVGESGVSSESSIRATWTKRSRRSAARTPQARQPAVPADRSVTPSAIGPGRRSPPPHSHGRSP